MVASMVNRLGSWIAGDESTRQLNNDSANQPFHAVASRYAEDEAYYDNRMYDAVNGVVTVHKARRGLYRNIRPIRNPMRRAIDWYPGKLYPGAMTPDGKALPDGTPCCIPFATDTEDDIRLAFTQAFEWGNFGKVRMAFGRGLPMLGDQFGEVCIDYDRRKVYPQLVHPKFVVDAQWNGSGDLISYRLSVPMRDPDTKKDYKWGKLVTQEVITTFYDDQPHGYDGQPATIANPWGFVSATWCQFRDVGGQHGSPLSDGVRSKIDEINNICAPIHDYIGKFVNQGIFVAGTNRKEFEAANQSRTEAQPTAEQLNPQAGRQTLNYLFGGKDTTLGKLIENLGLGEADSHVARMIEEVEADLPESTIDQRLAQLTTPPSGVALGRMFGGPETRAFEAQANADDFVITLGQMCLTIGGELANSGAWGMRSDLTKAQQKFLPFSLDSYEKGDTDVTFVPRPIFPDTPEDRIARAIQIESLTTASGMKLAGLDNETIYGPLPLPDGSTEYPETGFLREPAAAPPVVPGSTTPTVPGSQPTTPTEPGLAADPNSAAAFFARHVPPAMRATGGANG